MPPRYTEDPTPAEWKILSLVWDEGPLAARDVLSSLEGETDWSTSTVKTLLRRLVDKGHLRTRKVGNSFLYSASKSPLRSLRRAGEDLLGRASGATVAPLLAHLVKNSGLDSAELENLRALIDRLAKEAEA